MRRLLAGLGLLVSSALLLSAGGAPRSLDADSAVGNGAIHFGEAGVGFFDFNVTGGDGAPAGTFVFAGENHHGYPEILVKLHHLIRVEVSGRRVKIMGHGTWHNDEDLTFVAIATDGGSARPDTFEIRTSGYHDRDGDGPHFEAKGELFRGDIRVGLGEQ